ncbi:MAG: 50S ribosomal protein L30 [Bernardetiaceae bacterium]|jgi:large subunit ribosomal protein L30|nr:50S ribosomal protein L30 [Bernardetiaceae bacterium]
MAKLEIKQIKSTIKKPRNQKETIKSLGLGKINRVVIKEANPQILGMVRTVAHLIEVKEIAE